MESVCLKWKMMDECDKNEIELEPPLLFLHPRFSKLDLPAEFSMNLLIVVHETASDVICAAGAHNVWGCFRWEGNGNRFWVRGIRTEDFVDLVGENDALGHLNITQAYHKVIYFEFDCHVVIYPLLHSHLCLSGGARINGDWSWESRIVRGEGHSDYFNLWTPRGRGGGGTAQQGLLPTVKGFVVLISGHKSFECGFLARLVASLVLEIEFIVWDSVSSHGVVVAVS